MTKGGTAVDLEWEIHTFTDFAILFSVEIMDCRCGMQYLSQIIFAATLIPLDLISLVWSFIIFKAQLVMFIMCTLYSLCT